MPSRTYTAAEVDAAIEALQDPDRFAHAQEVVAHAAPGLQRVLNEALAVGGWFEEAHRDQLRRAAANPDFDQQIRELSMLLAEETRLGMLVGVAVGFELAHELQSRRAQAPGQADAEAPARAGDSPDPINE